MTCDEAEALIHALIDSELDAGHAREVEAHLAGCAQCSAKLRSFRAMRQAMAAAKLDYEAPPSLRASLGRIFPGADAGRPTRRALLKGLAAGGALSAIAASGVFMMVMRAGDDRRMLGEIVSAHLRSLQAEHLTDVQSSDQHTVKPWFNGRLDVAPPVVDLTSQGFRLLGGRLDYVNGRPAAAIVYRRRVHVINLFVTQGAGPDRAATMETVQGFNMWGWSEQGLNFWAVSDINADELQEFGEKFRTALDANKGT
jgi:anti-sigma factor RsiW